MSTQERADKISVMSGIKNFIDQTIERSNVETINNEDNNNNSNHNGLSKMDRKFIAQLLVCAILLIVIPILLILFLITSELGSIMALSASLMFLGCCSCIGCANIYWIKKENNGYHQI